MLALAAAAALTFATAPAGADGYMRGGGYRAPAYTNWSGFYLGGHIGGAWSRVDWADVDLTGEPVDNDSSGFLGGGQIGFNVQSGNIVFGIEGTYSGTNLGDDATSVVNPAVTYSTDINHIWTVTGRLGVAADKWLFYAKGGWAAARVEISGNNPGLPDAFAIDDWRHGWTVGGGLEYSIARNVSLGVEYNYVDLGDKSYTGTTAAGLPFAVTDVDTQIHSVVGRLNFRFNHPDVYRPLK